jgi:hypothetical protein
MAWRAPVSVMAYIFAPVATQRVHRKEQELEDALRDEHSASNEGTRHLADAEKAKARLRQDKLRFASVLCCWRIRVLLRLHEVHLRRGLPGRDHGLTVLKLDRSSHEISGHSATQQSVHKCCVSEALSPPPDNYCVNSSVHYGVSKMALGLSGCGAAIAIAASPSAALIVPIFMIGASYRSSARKAVEQLQHKISVMRASALEWNALAVKAYGVELQAKAWALAIQGESAIVTRRFELAFLKILPLGFLSLSLRYIRGFTFGQYLSPEESLLMDDLEKVVEAGHRLL